MKCILCERDFSIEDLKHAVLLKQTWARCLYQFNDVEKSVHLFKTKDLKHEPIPPEPETVPIGVKIVFPVTEPEVEKPNIQIKPAPEKRPDWPWR